ncbi:MAG TPA: transposase [Chthonomonadales bacterium]|nr:transposase [Chthonomonadales bacterium]
MLPTTVSLPEISFPFVSSKPVVARFDGGDSITDTGVLLPAAADRKLGLSKSMAAAILDARDPTKTAHTVSGMLRERMYAIGLGYEDANDLDSLADDP